MVFVVVTGVAAGLVELAHLTIDVPEAAEKWIAWAVYLKQFLPSPPFLHGFLTAWLLAALILWLAAWTERIKQAPPVAAAVVASPEIAEPLAPNEYIEQFRAFYHYLARAVRWAIDLLDAGVCGAGAASEGPSLLISQLIREDLLPSGHESLERLDSLVTSGDWSESKLSEVLALARQLLNGDYRRLTAWIMRAGIEILGGEQNLNAMAGYHELRYRHWELFTEARRIRTHSRLSGIVPLLADVERFFPGLARQQSMTILQGMSARELQAHARSEGPGQFLGCEWGAGKMVILTRQEAEQGRGLKFSCKTADNFAIILEDIQPSGLEERLQPGAWFWAIGKIKAIADYILVSPATVAAVENEPSQTSES